MKDPFLRKSESFSDVFAECEAKLEKIKQKNNTLQKSTGSELQKDIVDIIHQQNKQLKIQLNQLKKRIEYAEKNFTDISSKNKIKGLKKQCSSQAQRFKLIMNQLIGQSFARKSMLRNSSEQRDQNEQDKLMVNNNTQNEKKFKFKKPQIVENHIDFQLEQSLQKQNQNALKEMQKEFNQINEVVGEMCKEVIKQDQDLDIINEDIIKTYKNVTKAKQEMQQADSIQKRSRCKYILFALLVLGIVGGVVAVIVLTTK